MDEARGLLVLLVAAAAFALLLLTARLVWATRRPERHTAGYALARGGPCDPGDLGYPHVSWLVEAPGGARLPVWEITPGNGAACPYPGLTAVLVHGWGQSRTDMLNRLEPWPGLCERIVLYDLRGHGEAEAGLSRLGHGEEEDLLRLLESVRSEAVMLVGHSMGAVIAMHAVARRDARAAGVLGLVAYGTYDDFHRSLRARLRLTGLPARPLTDLAMLWFRTVGLRHRPTAAVAATIERPLLLVHGVGDAVAPLAHARRIAGAAADAELYAAEGAGHRDAHLVHEHHAAIRRFVDRAYHLDGSKNEALRSAGA